MTADLKYRPLNLRNAYRVYSIGCKGAIFGYRALISSWTDQSGWLYWA